MRKRPILGLCLLVAATPLAAQEAGGVAVEPAAMAGLSGLAQLPAYVYPGATATDIQGTIPAANRSANHRNMIAKVRGDGGFLDGFAFGKPQALSRTPVGPPLVPNFNLVQNFNAPVTSGNGNIVNHLVAHGQGPIAQQVNICTIDASALDPSAQATLKLLCGGNRNAAGGEPEDPAGRR